MKFHDLNVKVIKFPDFNANFLKNNNDIFLNGIIMIFCFLS